MHRRSKIVKGSTFVFIVLFTMLLFLYGCTNNYEGYSDSINPQEYLEFELLDNNTYQVAGFSGKAVKNLVIPNSHNGIDVTEIKECAFVRDYGRFAKRIEPIETVIIEEGIIKINDEAFRDCGATVYRLADSVEYVGYNAFYSSSKKTINIPENIKTIRGYGFSNTNISGDLFLDNIVLGEGCFENCDVEKVTFSDYYTEIPSFLFADADKLETVVFSDTITTICHSAFYKCISLKTITIGKNIEFIGCRTFCECGLETLNFECENVELDQQSFAECENLNNVNFNNSYCIDIGIAFWESPINNITANGSEYYKVIDGALCNYDESSDNPLEIIIGPSDYDSFDKVSSIGKYAFSGRNFDKLILLNNIQSIGYHAFSDSIINELEISIDYIGNSFYYSSIKNATISSKEIGEEAFDHIYDLEILTIGEGCEHIDIRAFISIEKLKEVHLPQSLVKIAFEAFVACNSITDVYYDLADGDPVYLAMCCFRQMTSGLKGDEINATIRNDFKIHVYKNVYNKCFEKWNDISYKKDYGDSYNFNSHIVVRD